ncbi:phasin family protein [Halomonas heilongjiangensis]|uniref:Phasin family protein n=1 Tax=Halomonas heilongjiangensis TaxID=1387883 RepID=A0A2N7TL79_9GAMM|nr:phasin family protein [Halomonas heilongjiangensis]PMR68941.1 phasin family protein [Halomonas heilongjiangensis]PXX87484.1 phasin family protein [Halomonas heilongjiangensis]PXX91168.1 phasin family protein [Halomonas heilongjiangensis]
MTNAFAFDTKSFDTAQLESLFFGPARAFAALSIDFTEQLVTAQLDATKAYADSSLAQLRSLVEVKDAEGLKSYLEGQQQVAKDLTERLKGDADKVVALQQDFIQESQKLTEGSVQQAQESLQQATETATKPVKEVASKAK